MFTVDCKTAGSVGKVAGIAGSANTWYAGRAGSFATDCRQLPAWAAELLPAVVLWWHDADCRKWWHGSISERASHGGGRMAGKRGI